MRKFSEWLTIREQMAPPGQPAGLSMASSAMKKPMLAGRDKTLDNVRSVLKKAKDPKSPETIKKVAQIYDADLDKATDSGQLASIASKKSSTLTNLLK
jgi:hypothetical protein